MEGELTAKAKPFVPQSSIHQSHRISEKQSGINATALPFVPGQLSIAPALSVPAATTTIDKKSNSKLNPDKKIKKVGNKKDVKGNGTMKEKSGPTTATTKPTAKPAAKPTTKPTAKPVAKSAATATDPGNKAKEGAKSTVVPHVQSESKKMKPGNQSRREKEKEKVGKNKEKEREKEREKEKSLREDEVRQLTSRLREKDARLKEMEALQSQENIAQSAALAKKVEEEVTQKLFKASLLSDMYKNSLSTPEQTAQVVPSKSSKQQQSDRSGGKDRDRDRDKDKEQSRRRGRGDSKNNSNTNTRKGAGGGGRGGRGGGLLHMPAELQSSTDRDRDSGDGVSSSSSSQARGVKANAKTKVSTKASVKAYEMTPEELRERDLMRAVKERAAADRRIATLESETKDILGNIRKSKPLLQDFCLLGIGQGAPVEFVEKCSALETHYSTQILQRARPVSPSSLEGGGGRSLVLWAQQMCDLWRQQTGLIRQVIDKAEKKGGIDDSSIRQIRNVFLNELEVFVERALQILEPLEKILSEDYILARTSTTTTTTATSTSAGVKEEEEEGDEALVVVMLSEQEKQLRSAMQLFLLAIADMGRLQLLYTHTAIDRDKDASSGSGAGSGDYLRSLKQQQVEAYMQRALIVAPHDGAPFASLSKMALVADMDNADSSTSGSNKKKKKMMSGNAFLAAYYLARGMGAEEPYLAAREALLDIFEDQKSLSDSLESVTALSRLSLSDHILRYQVHFLAAVGVAYSRTGADRLNYHLTKARRHVGTMLQLVSTSQLSEQNRGGKGGFASFDQKAFQKQKAGAERGKGVRVSLEERQLAQCREVDVCLCQSLVIALALIESVGGAHDIHRVCEESQWTAAYANWLDQSSVQEGEGEGTEWTLEDRLAHLSHSLSPDERRLIEQRYVLQRLHRLQSIPGLLDILRLVVGLLASLLGTESIGNSLDSERREGKHTLQKSGKGRGGGAVAAVEVPPRALATSRVLALFFEWLQTHPQYHAAITVLDLGGGGGGGGGGWESVEAELPQLVSGLRSLADHPTATATAGTAAGTISSTAKDDVDLLGFLPLQTSTAQSTTYLPRLERSALRLFAGVSPSPSATSSSSHHSFDSPQEYVRSNLVSFEQQTVAWVCHYASRCCRTVRDLCKQAVEFGEMTFHVDSTTGKRQALLPCDGSSAGLTVIVYKAVAPTSFSGFKNVLGKTQGLGSRQTNFILSKEDFMSGAVVTEPEQEQGQEDVSEDEGNDEDSVGDDSQDKDEDKDGDEDEEGDLSSLSDEGDNDNDDNDDESDGDDDHDNGDGDGDDDDDDLDLDNLVLEGQEQEQIGGFPPPPPPPPPPGFSTLQTQTLGQMQGQEQGQGQMTSEYVDEDFAAMCAALLTVPLTATTATATATTVTTNTASVNVSDTESKSTKEKGKEKEKEKEKEKGGLLHVKIPAKTLPAPPSTTTTTTGEAKSASRRNNPSSKQLRSYDSRGSHKSGPNSTNVYSNSNSKSGGGSNVYSSISLTSSGEIPLIVVDAPNVAMRHGLNAKFSCKGIQLALNFFHSAGHKVIAFLPDYYLNFERVGELRRLASLNLGEVRASQLPDDIEVLQSLVQQGFVIGTPSQDYDDSYCITYAQRRGGYIISNDMYRDHVKRIESKEPREEARKWIKSHVISYTFVGDEFLPNPDASIFAR